MSEEAPKAPEGRRQLGIGSFFKPAPPITQQQREEQQEAARKKFQDVVAQQRKEAAERIEEQEKNKRGPGRPRKSEQLLHTVAGKPIKTNEQKEREAKKKKKKRKRLSAMSSKRRRPKSCWFHPAVFIPILDALKARQNEVRSAVRDLKLARPEIYERLDESTVRG